MTIFRTATRRSAIFSGRPRTRPSGPPTGFPTNRSSSSTPSGTSHGIPILTPEQVQILRDDLAALTQPSHPGHRLFYEYNSNESVDPSRVLFHALGAWRITPGFHDLLWNPAFLVPASQLLRGGVRFWHDQLFSNRPVMAAWSPGIRTTPTGRARSRCRT